VRWVWRAVRRRAPTGERPRRPGRRDPLCTVLRATDRERGRVGLLARAHRAPPRGPMDPCVALHGEEQERPGAGQLAGRRALACPVLP
jgi:hypothetical protein